MIIYLEETLQKALFKDLRLGVIFIFEEKHYVKINDFKAIELFTNEKAKNFQLNQSITLVNTIQY